MLLITSGNSKVLARGSEAKASAAGWNVKVTVELPLYRFLGRSSHILSLVLRSTFPRVTEDEIKVDLFQAYPNQTSFSP